MAQREEFPDGEGNHRYGLFIHVTPPSFLGEHRVASFPLNPPELTRAPISQLSIWDSELTGLTAI
jgi:hypothetical protein